MKLAVTTLFAAFAASFAQEATLTSKQSLKERLVEHRADQFRDNDSKLSFIKEHHEHRIARLEEMIEERRRMTEDHESGRRRLSAEEYDRASRQYQNFQRKLEQMKKRTDEDHYERLQELKDLHNMNRIDYLDLKETVGAPN